MRNGSGITICFAVCALALLTRQRRGVIRVKTKSNRAFERFQVALSTFGVQALKIEETNETTMDFVWISSRKGAWIPSLCWNRLCGTRCLEDKRILGEIFQNEPKFFFESYSISNLDEFRLWWDNSVIAQTKRFWVFKDACANGGCGIWFIDRLKPSDKETICMNVLSRKNEAGFTIQEYLPGQPLLWNGRKFHFRVAAIITANGRAFLHRTAFVHPANKQFDFQPELLNDTSMHVTNLCVNLAQNDPENFVGEIRTDLINDYPLLWPQMLSLWATVVERCHPFMKFQRSQLDFEYIGLDLIANEKNELFLIEANCPPALSSATGYSHAQAMHDEILFDLFQSIVARAILLEKKILTDVDGEGKTGGFFECPTSNLKNDIVFMNDYHTAQAKCELAIMLYLRRKRKKNKAANNRIEYTNYYQEKTKDGG